MSHPLISIIVPVYKVETFLPRCVESILAQTYPHLEIILVDDGSPDRCGEICDDYARKDSRIKVIHQDNGGVSAARQTGLDNAAGEYVIHADPDDRMEAEMIFELYQKARDADADMVICDYWQNEKGRQIYVSQNPGEDLRSDVILRKILLQQLHGSCWNKFVRRRCFDGIGFHPRHICICEDELINIRLLNKGLKVAYLPKAFYHYHTDNPNSLCHAASFEKIQSKIDVIAALNELHLLDASVEDGFAIKKNVLFDAWQGGYFAELRTLYPEIHEAVIGKGTPYKILNPQACCLAIALKGYPRLALQLYGMNMRLINLKEWIKNKLC